MKLLLMPSVPGAEFKFACARDLSNSANVIADSSSALSTSDNFASKTVRTSFVSPKKLSIWCEFASTLSGVFL